MTTRDVFIVGAARTPIGSFQGALSAVAAPQLGATAIRAALSKAKVAPDQVGEVYMGCVLAAGIGQSPARQASLAAGIPVQTPTTTIGKVCGSGLQSVILGAKAIWLGDAEVVVAGGMESMSRVPYYLPKARDGYRMGHGQVLDGMIHDGLWDPYKDFHMGSAAEICAREHQITRDAQDAFARESYRRAIAAQKEGKFDAEIAPVQVPQRKGDPIEVKIDEEPGKGDPAPAKMAALRPAFEKDGTITAANASKINDGGAAVVLASAEAVKAGGLTPLARIVGHGAAAQAPEWFTTAPIAAIEATCRRTGVAKGAIDLWEINEAFAVVALVTMQKLGLDAAKVNPNGGAVALGHPIGASGARILTTLLHAMADRKVKRGLATLCIGGGEAVALLVEAA